MKKPKVLKVNDTFKYKGMEMTITHVHENSDIDIMTTTLLGKLPTYRMEQDEFWRLNKKRIITFDRK